MGCTMLGDEHFSRVYHEEFLSWYAQREVQKTSGSERVEVSFQMSRLPVERLVMAKDL